MTIDAVVAGVKFSADKPFPERGIGGVESFVPSLVPVEEPGVDVKAPRETLLAEFFDEGRIGEIGLGFEFFRGVKVFLFFPMHSDLSFGEFVLRCLRFYFLASFCHGDNSPWKIDFGCDATTRDSPVRKGSLQCRMSLP